MTVINTKHVFVNLKGEPIESEGKGITLGDVLANIILTPHEDKKGFRPLKAWELAQKLSTQTEVEVDKADFVQIKEIVENTKTYNPLIIGQVMEQLAEVKE